jgi:hypothetical protein
MITVGPPNPSNGISVCSKDVSARSSIVLAYRLSLKK